MGAVPILYTVDVSDSIDIENVSGQYLFLMVRVGIIKPVPMVKETPRYWYDCERGQYVYGETVHENGKYLYGARGKYLD